MPTTPCDRFDEAIDALWDLAISDIANLEQYKQQIADLRFRKIDCEFAAIHNRTHSLQAAVLILQQAISIASGSTPASVLARVRSLVDAINLDAAPAPPAIRSRRGRSAQGTSVSHLPHGRLRVLCVHGVGDHRDGRWKSDWLGAMQKAVDTWNPLMLVEPVWCDYDDLVVEFGVDAGEYAEAVARLGWSGIVHGIGDLFRRPRGLFDIPEAIRWSAGMVAQWSADESFRLATRQRVLSYFSNSRTYDAVFAHSLGSLVVYDTILQNRNLLGGGALITFGSQIGNPFVRGAFGGALAWTQEHSHWYHLYNRRDRVFTKDIRLSAPNFQQIDTPFDTPNSMTNHDATTYLGHENTISSAWKRLVTDHSRARSKPQRAAALAALTTVDPIFARSKRTPDQRALLIGINDYPDPADRLDGCVNDVFKMSALLQEMKFAPDEIRVVLNDRATADGIRERLDWLLCDVQPGDTRVLYYSGHGAQIAAYGAGGEPDHLDECLVPWDFDWSLERAITDDDLFEYYANLPYDEHDSSPGRNATLVIILDCCHSGGMERGGTAPRSRGLAPPDDIRHRALKWNRELNMWVPREFKDSLLRPVIDDSTRSRVDRRRSEFLGSSGAVHRIGSAAPLRWRALKTGSSKKKARKEGAASGPTPGRRPFMPLIIQACQENQFAYEYRHGVEAHGAFTWSMASALGSAARKGHVTFEGLIKTVQERLEMLGYEQRPDLRGPGHMKKSNVPWQPLPSRPPAPPKPPKRAGKRRSGKSARKR